MRIGLSFREPLLGEAVACLLENRRSWSVGFVARSVSEALISARSNSVSVLVVDTLSLESGELQGLLALRESGSAAVVLLVAEPDPTPYVGLPVDRVLSRHSTTDELFATLDELARPVGRARHGSLPFDLSRRELECAQLVARGLSNRRIAELTGLREQSVKNVVSLAMRKMSVENRVQVALRLTQAGVSDTVPVKAVVSLSMPEKVEAGR
ncbi:response regulator transcription factor [bacterium]|nr:MAG: response regulator transcription factor [bacterium]